MVGKGRTVEKQHISKLKRRERERERQTETDRQTETETHRDTQTQRGRDRETDRKTERQRRLTNYWKGEWAVPLDIKRDKRKNKHRKS